MPFSLMRLPSLIESATFGSPSPVATTFACRHNLGRHRAQRAQVGLVVQAGQERDRIREVRAVVVVPVEPARGVKGAAHRNEAAHAGWMPQCEQHRVEGAERCAGGNRRAGDARQDLFEDVGLVLQVARDSLGRRQASRVPRLVVNAVDADHLEIAAVDPVRDGADESEVLPLIEAAHRGRECQERAAAAAEMQQLHVTPEGVTVVLVVLALHRGPSVEDARGDRSKRKGDRSPLRGTPSPRHARLHESGRSHGSAKPSQPCDVSAGGQVPLAGNPLLPATPGCGGGRSHGSAKPSQPCNAAEGGAGARSWGPPSGPLGSSPR